MDIPKLFLIHVLLVISVFLPSVNGSGSAVDSGDMETKRGQLFRCNGGLVGLDVGRMYTVANFTADPCDDLSPDGQTSDTKAQRVDKILTWCRAMTQCYLKNYPHLQAVYNAQE